MSVQTHVASQEFPCPQPVSTSIRVGGGSIAVTAEDRPFAVVTVDPYDASDASHQAAEQTEITLNGDRLRIEVPRTGAGRIFRRDGKVRVEVRIPLDNEKRPRMTGAPGSGAQLNIQVRTARGDITLRRVAATNGA
jgi:hypothetical protein